MPGIDPAGGGRAKRRRRYIVPAHQEGAARFEVHERSNIEEHTYRRIFGCSGCGVDMKARCHTQKPMASKRAMVFNMSFSR